MATEALVAAMEPLIIIVMAGTVVPIILAVLMPAEAEKTSPAPASADGHPALLPL